jgi:DNA-binding response OmpR family regulator
MDFNRKKILIVDDEEDLCEILQYNLDNEGYITAVAHSAEEALTMSVHDFDLLLLDVMMGPISGFKLADRLRKEQNIFIPIIFLTAKDTENDLLTGFSLGADDYISKPFSINELSARVKAVLKRYDSNRSQSISSVRYGDVELDTERKRVIINNKQIELTRKEFEILKLLMENHGKIYSREDILNIVWEKDVIVTYKNVDVNITKLRNKLGIYGVLLKNKKGYGYYFEL